MPVLIWRNQWDTWKEKARHPCGSAGLVKVPAPALTRALTEPGFNPRHRADAAKSLARGMRSL